jgi:hypothetical protein
VFVLASLPEEMQRRWLELHPQGHDPALSPEISTEVAADPQAATPRDSALTAALARLPLEERRSWVAEVNRLRLLIERYAVLNPKRCRNPVAGKSEFVPAVIALCEEAVCTDQVVLAREPHRARPPSPSTMDDWLRDYREVGSLAFVRTFKESNGMSKDKRRAKISPAAVDWINNNWRKYHGPRPLYKALSKEAEKQGWRIPSESWLDRRWREMPKIVKTSLFGGKTAYESRLAPYVPRDYSDLAALQVLCGDHSERDVTVLLADGSLARPWLTVWLDLRTWLLWGWHLDLVPSSVTAGLAYADGVRNFGAQPLSRTDEGFFSYIYTDRGRDYRSHDWNGRVIRVHENAIEIDGSLELICVERRIGILDELEIKHLLARGRNGKEKPVERFFKDVSEWEKNTFAEYCGRDPSHRPDCWRELYTQHQKFARGKRDSSPFIPFDEYRAKLAEFITGHNSSPHERVTLGGRRIVPFEEYGRLYRTRYEISAKTLALLLMKPAERTIDKNGVHCFRPGWNYYHEAMAGFKGCKVEVRYTEGDYSRIWVILPDKNLYEATLITPTSILNPNKATLQAVAVARAHEQRVIRDYQLIAQSQSRGETAEDRVAQLINPDVAKVDDSEAQDAETESQPTPAIVHRLTRLDRKRFCEIPGKPQTDSRKIGEIEADWSIFCRTAVVPVREYDYDDQEESE